MQALTDLNPEQLLKPEEAAELLTISPDTLRRWRYERRGPGFTKVGTRSVRYRAIDLSNFLKSVQPTSQDGE
jgi:predicted site-specific integrase-resolvase